MLPTSAGFELAISWSPVGWRIQLSHRGGLSEYVQKLVKSLKESHHVARQNLKKAQKNMKRNNDLCIWERNYGEEDKVYVLDNTVIKGKSKQPSAPWKGSEIILEKVTSYLFRVQIRNKVMVVNHDRIKMCIDKQPSMVGDL